MSRHIETPAASRGEVLRDWFYKRYPKEILEDPVFSAAYRSLEQGSDPKDVLGCVLDALIADRKHLKKLVQRAIEITPFKEVVREKEETA